MKKILLRSVSYEIFKKFAHEFTADANERQQLTTDKSLIMNIIATHRPEVLLEGEGSVLDAISLLMARLRRVGILEMGTAQLITQHSQLVSAICEVLYPTRGHHAIEIIKEFFPARVEFKIRWTDDLPRDVVCDQGLVGVTLEGFLIDAARLMDESTKRKALKGIRKEPTRRSSKPLEEAEPDRIESPKPQGDVQETQEHPAPDDGSNGDEDSKAFNQVQTCEDPDVIELEIDELLEVEESHET